MATETKKTNLVLEGDGHDDESHPHMGEGESKKPIEITVVIDIGRSRLERTFLMKNRKIYIHIK